MLSSLATRPSSCAAAAAAASWPLARRRPAILVPAPAPPPPRVGGAGRCRARRGNGGGGDAAPSAAKTADCYIGFDAGGAYPALSAPCSGPSCVGVGLFAAAALSFGAAYWFKGQQQRLVLAGGRGRRRGVPGGAPEPWPEIPSAEDDPDGYRLALARTRQAQHVSRASALTRAGDPARAMVELGRALHENDACRSPLLDGHHSAQQLAELYVLFVQNSPTVPPPFAHLLQLRVMLGLGEEVAEELEAQALREAAAFSI